MRYVTFSLLFIAYTLQGVETLPFNPQTPRIEEKGLLRGPRGHHGSRGHSGRKGKRGNRGKRGHRGPAGDSGVNVDAAEVPCSGEVDGVNGLLQFRTEDNLPSYYATANVKVINGGTEVTIDPGGFGWYVGQIQINLDIGNTEVTILKSDGSTDSSIDFFSANTNSLCIPFLFQATSASPKLRITINRVAINEDSRLIIHKVGEPDAIP